VKRSTRRRKSLKAKSSSSANDELLTGSLAPNEIPRTLEAGIGAEIRRLRKEFDLLRIDVPYRPGRGTTGSRPRAVKSAEAKVGESSQ
jgi:hypothetical protein